MGRFNHEAAAVDPRTGIVYLTEDREDGLFYRFLPERRGRLHQGGRLQALAFAEADRPADSRNASGVPCRSSNGSRCAGSTSTRSRAPRTICASAATPAAPSCSRAARASSSPAAISISAAPSAAPPGSAS